MQLTGLPIVDDSDHVVGFVSEQDCIKQILESSYHWDEVVKVTKVMQPNVLSVTPGDSVVDVATRMITDKPKIYPVIEDGLLVGVITRAMILRALKHLKTLWLCHCARLPITGSKPGHCPRSWRASRAKKTDSQ